MPTPEIHALAKDAATLRIWLGIVDDDAPTGLEWRIDGQVRQPTSGDLPSWADEDGDRKTQTGVYDFDLSESGTVHQVAVTVVWADGRRESSVPLMARALPPEVPQGMNQSFNVLLVSCFFEPRDSIGKAGQLVESFRGTAYQPDLVLTVGDQVYLDNPWVSSLHFTRKGLAQAIEEKYWKNWRGSGYASILRSAPVAGIPDDHEYWNNYPQLGVLWPATFFGRSRGNWKAAARNMYDAFQLAEPGSYSYSLDVAPLSFFIMDNRTFREEWPGNTMLDTDLATFDDWVKTVKENDQTIPVVVTGPSLFQSPKGALGTVGDLNISDFADYPNIMRGLLDLSSAGKPVLALTGDVHYGRVIYALHATGNRQRPWNKLHEVISSPLSLVSKYAGGEVKDVDRNFHVAGTGTTLSCVREWPRAETPDMGDHLTLLRFRRTATGVDLEANYWMIRDAGRPPSPHTTTLKLQRFPA